MRGKVIAGAVTVRGKGDTTGLEQSFDVISVNYMSQQKQTEVLNSFSDNTDMSRINMEMSQFNGLRNSKAISTHEPIE